MRELTDREIHRQEIVEALIDNLIWDVLPNRVFKRLSPETLRIMQLDIRDIISGHSVMTSAEEMEFYPFLEGGGSDAL